MACYRPIIASGGRSNTEYNTPKVKLLHVRLSPPIDMLELWSISESALQATLGHTPGNSSKANHVRTLGERSSTIVRGDKITFSLARYNKADQR
jgi:hypothetical protein